ARNSIVQRGAPPDQLRAQPEQHQRRLLFLALDRHELHRWPAHRLAQRLGVAAIVLVALDVGLDVLRRHQLHLVTLLRSSRAQKCEAPQASIPITVGGSLAKNATTSLRRSFRRNTGRSAASTPCN